jgi:orotidine-5'-phosphate decarboxylase
MNDKKIIIALDSDNLENSLNIVKRLKNDTFAFKIGYEFFYNFGTDGYNSIKDQGVKIFLDLKLHDIPNTVEKAIKALSKLEPYFLTIHISGGDEMQKVSNLSKNNIKILGVSILTSLDSDVTKKFYFNKNIEEIVSIFANSALENKLDGIVCSPKEIKKVRKLVSNNLLIITPGIRPLNYQNSNDDQSRTMTPKEAIDAGANYLVIGRPITQSKNSLETLKKINASLA